MLEEGMDERKKGTIRERELAKLVVRLARALATLAPASIYPAQAAEYLSRECEDVVAPAALGGLWRDVRRNMGKTPQ
jgi:hypothetical protein